MNNKALTLSVLMGVIGVFFVQSYVSSIEEEAKRKFGTEVLVVSAKRDIREMETLNETALEFRVVPKKFLEPGAVSVDQKAEDTDSTKELKRLAGSIAVVAIKKGEQVTFSKITEPSMRTGLSPQVAPGKRAITVPVNEVSGVGKLVKPGDRVDVILIMDPGGGRQNKISKTVLQDVVVLSVGRNVTNNVARLVEPDPFTGKEKVKNLAEYDGFSSVTLELEPAQAQALALLVSGDENKLILSLRNNDDQERVTLPSVMYDDVLGGDALRVRPRQPAGNQGGGGGKL